MVIVAGFFLIAIAAIPLVVAFVLNQRQNEHVPSRPSKGFVPPEVAKRDRETREPERDPSDRGASDPRDPSRTEPGSTDPEDPTEKSEAERIPVPRARIVGGLRRERLAIAEEAQLSLRAAGGEERRLATDEEGEFAFEVAEGDLPITLIDSDGTILYECDDLRSAPTYVNVQRLLPTQRFGGLLVPSRVVVEHSLDGSITLDVRGTTLLPNGAQVFCTLSAGTQVVSSSRTSVRDGTFRFTRMTSNPGEALHSGRYLLDVAWRPLLASRTELEAVAEYVPEPPPEELSVRRNIYVGRKIEEESETAESIEFFYGALAEAQAGRDTLYWLAWTLRGVPGQKPDRSDPYWSAAARMFDDPNRVRLVQSSEIFKELSRFVGPKKIDIAKWREYIDETLPRRWARYCDVSQFPHRTKYPVATANLPALFQELLRFYHIESRLIYASIKRTPHPNDYYSHDFTPAEEWLQAQGRIDRYFGAVREEIGVPKGGRR